MIKWIIDFPQKYKNSAEEQFGFRSKRGLVEAMTELK